MSRTFVVVWPKEDGQPTYWNGKVTASGKIGRSRNATGARHFKTASDAYAAAGEHSVFMAVKSTAKVIGMEMKRGVPVYSPAIK